MLIEDLALPYEYTDNSRAGSMTYVFLSAAASIALGVMAYFGVLATVGMPWWIALIPFGLVIHRSYTYSIYLNATHEALRNAEHDKRLDAYVEERMKEPVKHAVLDAQTFAEKLVADGNR